MPCRQVHKFPEKNNEESSPPFYDLFVGGVNHSSPNQPAHDNIKRNRPSEIDYINGEFINLANHHKCNVPLNKQLVEMVHKVEKTGKFFTKHQLLSEVKGLL